MGIPELLLLAVGLSMDAFAVAVCKGLSLQKVTLKQYATVGVWFGGFQALMPLIGYALGSAFKSFIEKFDHWAAFILLAVIGANMIKEALSKEPQKSDSSLNFKEMLLLAVATSIDALAVGITFAFFIDSTAYLIFAVCSIGIITFMLSVLGVKAGNIFGIRYKSRAELTGGIILIIIGIKILLEHLDLIK